MTEQKLILLDNDGTLVDGLGDYVPAAQRAIKRIFEKDVNIDLTNYHGHTDRYIVRDVLQENAISYDPESLDRCLDHFGEFYQADVSKTRVIPGVVDALASLYPQHQLGVLTGNVESMARKKLMLCHINHYLPFGAFGDEDVDRDELVRFAIHRASRREWSGDNSDIYLVGDTPLDIKAGLAAGIIPIGVTTGKATRAQLYGAGAQDIMDSLSELPEIVNS